jgi:hyperosmotically inducible periplasmic protein
MTQTNVLALLLIGGALLPSPAAFARMAPQTPTAAGAQERSADDVVKDRIEHRLETNARLRTYDIDVTVERGVATLSGVVASSAQKDEAARVAKVEGVSQVESSITVDRDVDKTVADRVKSGLSRSGETINDGWITTKINWFFVGEDRLKDSDIDVDTKDGTVTLKGTVRTSAGRARAMELARTTDGVKRVTNQLVVRAASRQ